MRKRWWLAALAVMALDQAAKFAARRLSGQVVLIPGVIALRYAENTGMAFSLFSGMPWVLGILSLALIVGGFLVLRRYTLGPLSRLAAMLMLGGAAGNLIDRLLVGYVVDMIEVLAFRFAIFNVADAALTVGCILMALSLLTRPNEWRDKRGNTEGNNI